MQRIPLFLFGLLASGLAHGQKHALPDSARFNLYLWYKPVGTETYTKGANGRTVDIVYRYEDRGTAVPMNSHLAMNQQFAPSLFTLGGKPGRFSVMADSLLMEGDKLSVFQRDTSYTAKIGKHVFPHYINSPATLYLLLIKYWEANGRPASINGLPENKPIHISYAGKDTFTTGGRSVTMHRYRMERERFMIRYLWVDDGGALAGMASGFLSFVNEKYADLLHALRTRTATHTLNELKAPGSIKDLVIRNARLVDMETGNGLYPAVVIVKKGSIAWTGPAASAVIPKGAKVLDAKGMTLLPGLWDMHMHYNNPVLGPALIGMGITSVRDCANQDDFISVVKASIDKGESIGPAIYRAGLIDGVGPTTLGIVTADTPEEGRQRVQEYKQKGYDAVKIYSSLKPEVVKAICEEAKRLGLAVTGHVPRGMKVQDALDAGMTQLNHINSFLVGFVIDTPTYTIDFENAVNRDLLHRLKEGGVVLDGTLAFLELARRNLDDDIRKLYPDVDAWPAFMQADIKTMGLPADTVMKYKYWLREALYKSLMLRFLKEGIPVVAGTDLQFYPGYTLYRELEIYVTGGMTPLQALQTATTIPATVMGRSAAIRAGNAADLILVEGDPLKRIEDIRRVRWVVKGGKVYDAPAIRRSVGFKK